MLPPKEVAFLMLLSSKIERSDVLSNFIRFDLPTVREMEKSCDLKLHPACRANQPSRSAT